MLVTINPSVGGVSTDDKTRFFNFLASLHAVATASAGSTPVVNPVNTSGVKNTSFNCISVISNSEAGGWTAGVSNSITASTSYNASFASPYLVDLFRSTGKSTYPYYRQLFGNYTYTFSNASFTSYPQSNIIQGHTNNNPASVAYNSDTSWYNGTWSFLRSTTSWTTYPTNTLLNISTANTTYYVAVTENYLIITQPLELLYFGVRDVSPWELTRTDNPPWCAFGFNGNLTGFVLNNSSTHSEHMVAWMSLLNDSNGQINPTRLSSVSVFDLLGKHVITGQTYNTGTLGVINGFKSLFLLAYPVNSSNANGIYWSVETTVTDPTTGLSVPPVYPIIFSYADTSARSCIGQVPGILKGMNQTAAGLTNYASATEYVVNGTPYQPILTGNPTYPDLFLLRKA